MSGETEYWQAHQAVKAIHGSASLHDCAFCSGDAKDWAYNHRDPNAKIARFNGCSYSTDPAYYIPLCRPCHLEFDVKHRRVQQFEELDLPADLTDRQREQLAEKPKPTGGYKRPGLAKIEPEDLTLFIIRTLSRAFEMGGISEGVDRVLDKLAIKARRAGVAKAPK